MSALIILIMGHLLPNLSQAQNCLSNQLTNAGVLVSNIEKADLQLSLDGFLLSATNLSVSLTVSNLHPSIGVPAGTPVTFYDADPTLTNARVVSQYVVPDAIASTQSRPYTIALDLSPLPYMPFFLFGVIGDNGSTQRPFVLDDLGHGPSGSECFFSNNKAGFSTIVPLPIELLNFDVKALSEDDFEFYWQTATEHDNHGFHLEVAKGNAGLSSFSSVAFVAGQGNSQTANNYRYWLWDLVPGQYYARLRQVDVSGEGSYSKVVSFKVGDVAPRVYPTIIGEDGVVNVLLSSSGNWSASVYDSEGRLLQTIERSLEQEESATLSMSVEGLMPGFYYIRIEEKTSGGDWTEKLVVVK